MSKIYIIRHGKTDWNALKRYQGKTDIPLNNDGIKEAQALAMKFKKINIDKIYASPLVRAFDTAKYLADSKGLGVLTIPELKEVDFGEWEGLSVSELYEKYPDAYTLYHNEPHNGVFPGEGSLSFVRERALIALNKIFGSSSIGQDDNIAIVSHGAISKILIIILMDLELSFYSKFWLDNTSVSLIEMVDNKSKLITLNNVCHLDKCL